MEGVPIISSLSSYKVSWLVKTLTASDKSVASCSSDRSIRTMSMKNASSVCFEDIDKSVANWKIPKVNIREIYHVGTFSLCSDYYIKTIEKHVILVLCMRLCIFFLKVR
jgi:hypothetical protein